MAALPPWLRPLFWDHDFEALHWPNDAELVVSRVLASGSWEAVRWLRGTAGDELIARWVRRRGKRLLSPRQLRFWQLILRLPKREVDGWIAAQREQPWGGRMAG